jgi:hypothetical protein
VRKKREQVQGISIRRAKASALCKKPRQTFPNEHHGQCRISVPPIESLANWKQEGRRPSLEVAPDALPAQPSEKKQPQNAQHEHPLLYTRTSRKAVASGRNATA